MIDPINLLKQLIATPSLSRHEAEAAALIEQCLKDNGVGAKRLHNNVWAMSEHYDPIRPTLLLNSHLDTVKPSPAYTHDPFNPIVADGKLYGLGSNDAGASLVGLTSVFLANYRRDDLPFNLMFAASAEEEITGENGMRALAAHWRENNLLPQMAIIGEPTGMDAAIGERGLVVLDCTAHAAGGHAARPEGENALYKAIDDIQRLRSISFPKCSSLLGPVKVTVTQIQAGRQHNVLPEECSFVVDVRTTNAMSNAEVVDFIRSQITSSATPRSLRINASVISATHPLVRAAVRGGAATFVSPTTSDMSVLPDVATLKIGIGLSKRSHTADEFIELREIADGINKYQQIIENLKHETLG